VHKLLFHDLMQCVVRIVQDWDSPLLAAKARAAAVRAPDAIMTDTIKTKPAMIPKVLYVECFSSFEQVIAKRQIRYMISLVSDFA
jgi:hypothetical protein